MTISLHKHHTLYIYTIGLPIVCFLLQWYTENCFVSWNWRERKWNSRGERRIVKSLIGGNLIHLAVLETRSPRRQCLRQCFLSSSFCISQSNSCPQGPAVSSKAPWTHSFWSRPLSAHSAALEPAYVGLSPGWPPGPSAGPDSTLPLIHTSKTTNTNLD